MGWEVKINMSGQSIDCPRVCNVKMKMKVNFTRAEMEQISKNDMGYGAVASSDLNFFDKIASDYWSTSCKNFLVNI